MRPVLVHSRTAPLLKLPKEAVGYDILHIMPAEFLEQAKQKGLRDILPVFNCQSVKNASGDYKNCLLQLRQEEISELSNAVVQLFVYADRINVNIMGIDCDFDEQLYYGQLQKIKESIINRIRQGDKLKELNLLTDICFLKEHDNCQAGENHFAVGVDKNLYTCPAFYSSQTQDAIGNLSDGITRNYSARLYSIENHPICGLCDAYHCNDCVYVNVQNTNEVNVSPSFQCRKSHIERSVSQQLLQELQNMAETCTLVEHKTIPKLGYLDPIRAFFDKAGHEIGIYKYDENEKSGRECYAEKSDLHTV